MKTQIGIENLQQKLEFSEALKSLIERAVLESLVFEGFERPCEISVMIVDDERIKEINKEQRNIDKATDVLSFPMLDYVDGQLIIEEWDFDLEGELLLLGDIVISLETAKRQAEEYGHSVERELAFLTTHGIFHLLGFDHMEEEDEKVMMGKQEDVLEKMGLKR